MRSRDLSLVHLVQAGAEPRGPAIVLLHGLGSNEHDLFSLSGEMSSALTVLSVRAPHVYHWGGHMWYDIEAEGPNLSAPGITASLQALDRFLDEAVAAYEVDPTRLYLAGFSQGAAMTGAYTLTRPDRVAGAIMLSGFLPPDPGGTYLSAQAAGLPIFQGHGTVDPVVPILAARMTRDFLNRTPVDLTYREYPIGHTVSPAELSDVTAWMERVLDG